MTAIHSSRPFRAHVCLLALVSLLLTNLVGTVALAQSPDRLQGPIRVTGFADNAFADNAFADDKPFAVPKPGVFPARIAWDLFNEVEALSNLVTSQMGKADGGRTVLVHMRDSFFPMVSTVLRSEMSRYDFAAASPFVDIFDREMKIEGDRMLDFYTDSQLNKIVFADSELDMLPEVWATISPVIAAQIANDTNGVGLLSGWFSLKWLWETVIDIGGCFAKGLAQILFKLVKILHDLVHSDDPPYVVASADLTTALTAATTFSSVVASGANSTTGGREVVQFALDNIVPMVTSKLESELIANERGDALPFLNNGLSAYQDVAKQLLKSSDDELNGLVYDQSRVALLAEAVLTSSEGLEAHIAAHTNPDGNYVATAGDPVKWFWGVVVEITGCVPGLGDLAKKLFGAAHDVAHSGIGTTTASPSLAVTGLSDLSAQVVALDGHPQRGRLLVTHVRDKTLANLQVVMEHEVMEQELPVELLQVVQLGIDRQYQRMSENLEAKDDKTLNESVYDSRLDVQVWASTYQETVAGDPTASTMAADPKTIWKWTMTLIKCLSGGKKDGDGGDDDESPDKISWALGKVHGLLH